MKLTEAQINAALGPPRMRPVAVPAPEAPRLPDTPMVAAMRAAGATDEQIKLVLETMGPGPGAGPAQEAAPAPEKPAARRGRPPKAMREGEGEIIKPKVEAKPEPAPEPQFEPAGVQAINRQAPNGNGEAGNGELKSAGASEGSAMPADLENLLDEMLGAHPK
jgi:hypothetical protein